MEKRLRMFMVLLGLPMLVLATVHCGDTPAALCARTYSAMKVKVGPCGTADFEKNQKTCEEQISKCSADERTKIDAGVTCIEKLEACVSGSELVFLASFGSCAASINGVSQECKNAISIDFN